MKQPDFLIPPRKYFSIEGVYKFPKTPIITSVLKEDTQTIKNLSEALSKSDLHPIAEAGAIVPSVLLQRDGTVKDSEGYILNVTKEGITVKASTAAGTFYGVQTLLELINLNGVTIPCCQIEDAPEFRRRGVYFDCSRGKVAKISTLKSLIDLLASWKINELQIYIENIFTFRKHPEIGKGFDPYTPDDILELQEYCNKRFISFVPSLASFGHMEKILMLSKYKNLGELPGHRNMAGGTTLNPGNHGSIKLIEDLFSEFVPLFKSTDFNVCGDEPWELGKGASKKVAAKKGVGYVYLDFILKIRELCLKHNKRMNLWSDIVLNHPEIIPSIPKDIVMLNWQYGKNNQRRLQRSNEITEAGLPLVCCPGTNSWQSHGTRLDQATEIVSMFAKKGASLKAEGLLNTDWGDGGHRNTLAVSLSSFAHGAAHGWNTIGTDDINHVERFTRNTFEDVSGKMAEAIRILGASESGSWAYATFNESLYEPKPLFHFFGQDFIRMNDTELPEYAFSKRESALKNISFTKLCKPEDNFKSLMIEEFDLATNMEKVAWERLRIAKQIRAKSLVTSLDLNRHKKELTSLAANFKKTWRKVNRESRLCDNMVMFEGAINEIK
jgi:hypothetical protein